MLKTSRLLAAIPTWQAPQRALALRHAWWIPHAILALGVVLRLAQFLVSRSLSLEEAALVNIILTRPLGDVLLPLPDSMIAPVGFQIVVKLLTQAFGSSELVLRLYPMLCGAVSLPLFYWLLRLHVRPGAVLTGTLLFAIDPSLRFFASEATPPSSDVLVGLVVLLAGSYAWRNLSDWRRRAVFMAVGAVAIWFSHPAVILVVGLGAALLLLDLKRRDRRVALFMLFTIALWALSFAALYVVAMRPLMADAFLNGFWKNAYMPFPPLTIGALRWYVAAFFGIFNNETGLNLTDVSALLFLVGCVSFFVTNRPRLVLLAAPFIVALAASAMELYPLSLYMMLYLAPLMLLFVAEGVHYIVDNTRELEFPSLSVAVLAFIFILPVYNLLAQPVSLRQDIRPALEYYQQNRQPGDKLYVYYFAQFAVEYYASQYDIDLKSPDYYAGRALVNASGTVARQPRGRTFTADLFALHGNPRVWVLFANAGTDEQTFTSFLGGIGERILAYRARAATVYLYDLTDEG